MGPTLDPPVVRTPQGLLAGSVEAAGVRVWRGVPYASAPVGAQRYTEAGPAPSWSGVLEATRFGPICPQPGLAGMPPADPMDESCLVLNVWSPAEAADLPVIVWLHGGGYFVGSGSAPVTAGSRLAVRGPAVVVTLNYRLGHRGFLDLSTLRGSDGRFVTNLGLRDQIQALAWVQENIEAFGGSPDRVTIAGGSAGGASVCCLVVSPRAVGLFGAAVAQSPPVASVFGRDRAEWVTRRFVELLGAPEAGLDDLLGLEESALLAASGQVLEDVAEVFPGHHAFQPVVDGDVLLDTPVRSVAAGHGSAVPLLIGSNQDEGSLFVRPPMPPLIPTTDGAIRRFLEQDRPDVAERVLAAYTDPSDDRFGAAVAAGGDGMVTVPAVELAEAQSRRAPVYAYRLRWTNDDLMTKRLGTPHTLDVPLVFGNPEAFGLTALTPAADGLSRTMQDAWLSFARDHVPDPRWPAYEAQRRAVMVLDDVCTVEEDPDGARRRVWS